MQSKDYRSTVLPPELQRMSIRTLDFNCLNAAASKLMVEHMKHVLAEVDKSHFAVSSKSRLKFLVCIWPCCQVRHIKLFITKN